MNEYSLSNKSTAKNYSNSNIRIESGKKQNNKISYNIKGKVLKISGDVSFRPNSPIFDYSFKTEIGKLAKASYTLRSKNTFSHSLIMEIKEPLLYTFLNNLKVSHINR